MSSEDFDLNLEGPPSFIFRTPSSSKPITLVLDFKVRKDAGSKNDLLYKALGRAKNKGKSVLDATAGLMSDSAHMAQLGYKVTALERHPILFKALNALLSEQPQQNLSLINADAMTYLSEAVSVSDIIYLDPMFPESSSSALSGKEAQLLKILAGVGNESENRQLLQLALIKAKDRVVVKRPRKSDLLLPDPMFQVLGKSTRYDVYKPLL